MKQAQTHRQLLDQLVAGGRLSDAEADELSSAPRAELSIREVVIYLAVAIISVGVVRLIIALFEDASRTAIAGAIYVGALGLTAASMFLGRGGDLRQRFAEVSEIASVAGYAIASGIMLSEWDLSGEASVLWPSLAVLAWGVYRCRMTRFAGTAMLPPAMLAFTIAFANLLDIRDEEVQLFPMVGAIALLVFSLTNVHSAVLLRLAGAVVLLSTVPGFTGTHADEPLSLLGLAIAVAIFAAAANRMWVELLLSGALQVVITVGIIVFTNVDNDVAQGLLVVAVGVVMLAVTSWVMRRGKNGVHMAGSPTGLMPRGH